MKGIVICIILSGFLGLNTVQSQNKARVRVFLEHFRDSEKRVISVKVVAKSEKKYRPVAGVEVALYFSEISSPNLLGVVETTDNGTVDYTLNRAQLELVKTSKIARYYAVVKESETLRGKKTSIAVKDVKMDVQFVIEDSAKQIHVLVSEPDSAGLDIPQKNVKIEFLVDRPLSPLPIGDEKNVTDKEGKASMDFPGDLTGDAEGYLKIFVRITEDDDYGTVEFWEDKPWGIPVSITDDTIKRSLWASGANAPIPLLILINALIIAVWGIIFFIVYKILQIRKLGAE